MYKKLERTKSFLKDLSKTKFSNEHYSKYVVHLGKLLSNETLPPEALDHPLKGDLCRLQRVPCKWRFACYLQSDRRHPLSSENWNSFSAV